MRQHAAFVFAIIPDQAVELISVKAMANITEKQVEALRREGEGL